MIRRLWIRTLVVLAVGCVAGLGPRAEFAVQQTADDRTTTSLMAIVDHPDPIDQNAWRLFREIDPERVLNQGGFARGDGSPDFATLPGSGWPLVVWPWNSGFDYDIAFAEWQGNAWSPVSFVAETAENEMDPRIALADDGTAWVAWWSVGSGSDGVYVSQRSFDNSEWSVPERVGDPGRAGRRPSIAVVDQTILVAFERDSVFTDMAQDVVVADMRGDGTWTFHIVASTTRTERLDVILHTAQGQIWVDWKHGDNEFGHAVAEGLAWTNWSTAIWTDPTWIGVEQTRRTIQNDILP